MLVSNILEKKTKEIPDEPAIISDDIIISHKELKDKVSRVVSLLEKENFPQHICIGLRFCNSINYCIFFLALLKLRIPQTAIYPNEVKNVQLNMIKETHVNLVFQDLPLTDILQESTIYVHTDLSLQANISMPIQENMILPKDTSVVFLGSGTTGKQKIIIQSSLVFSHIIQTSVKIFEGTSLEKFYCYAEVHYPYSRRSFLLALLKGMTVILPQKKPKDLIYFCTLYQIDHLQLTVSQANNILLNKYTNRNSNTLQLPHLKSCVLASSLITESTRKSILMSVTKNLYIVYGTNEFGLISVATPEDIKNHPGTVGVSIPGISVQILDDTGQKCEHGKVGNIVVKSKHMINSYFNNVEVTKKSFTEDGYYPGDLGRLTEDGNVIFEGRKDDMMIFSGVNIYPRELESVLESHPNIIESAVFPLTMNNNSGIPFAVVRVYVPIKEQELLQWCHDRLGWRRPQRIFIMKELPKNTMGKILKRNLIKMVERKLQINQKKVQQNKQAIIYREGIYYNKQLMKKANIELEKTFYVDLKRIDEWLINVLKIEVEPCDITLKVKSEQNNAHIVDTVWRILLLRKVLFQAIKIPIFDTGDIININEENNHYNILTHISHIDNITTDKIHYSLIEISMRLIKFFKNESNKRNITHLYAYLDKQLFKPYANMNVSGKSTIPILHEAHKQNIPFSYISQSMYQLGWGSKLKTINRSSIGADSAIGAQLSDNKWVASSVMREAGLPSPLHGLTNKYDEAMNIANKLGFPIVTKPTDLNRGEGVSIDIFNPEQLKKGFERAYKSSPSKNVIIEKQVSGVCCRIFIANRTMLYAVNRLPKCVVGNGKSCVEALIDNANQENMVLPPWKRTIAFPKDIEAINAINDVGYTFKSIPQKGELIPLRRLESTQWGGYDEDVTNTIHPENIYIAIKAANLFGLKIAGVDIISPDITKPWYQNGAIINEVNFSPEYGNGEISRGTISTFLNGIIEGDGRIPISVVIGDDHAMSKALSIQKEVLKENRKIFITSHNKTITYDQKEEKMLFNSLYKRIKALLMNENIEELIIVIQTYEFLKTGLPIDQIEMITVINNKLEKIDNTDNNFDTLLSLLKSIKF